MAWTIAAGRTVSIQPTDEVDINGVLFPGLVNAHAHLDLACQTALDATGSFTDWLLGVGAARQDSSTVGVRAGAQAASLGRRGVVGIGDIDGSMGQATRARRSNALNGKSYIEVLGTTAAGARSRLAQALSVVDALGGPDVGLSPHAPYSVHIDVLPEIARAASGRGLPLAMHLSESPEEVRFLQRGDGPFADFLAAIGKRHPFDRPPGIRPVALADRAGLLAAGCVVVHANELDDDDIETLRRHGSSVVYCHGTHRHFDRPAHRFTDLLSAGVNVALGTDSDLSNQGVDLFGEMCRLAADRPEISPETILEAGSLGGRRALGIEPEAALFRPGSAADGMILGPPPSDVDKETTQAVAEWALAGAAEVLLTLHQGHPVPALDLDSSTASGRLDTPSEQG